MVIPCQFFFLKLKSLDALNESSWVANCMCFAKNRVFLWYANFHLKDPPMLPHKKLATFWNKYHVYSINNLFYFNCANISINFYCLMNIVFYFLLCHKTTLITNSPNGCKFLYFSVFSFKCYETELAHSFVSCEFILKPSICFPNNVTIHGFV